MKKIAVVSPSFSKSQTLKTALQNRFQQHQIKFYDQQVELSGSALIDFLNDQDFAIIGKEQITAETLTYLPKLRGLSKYGVGLDNIDLAACKEQNVKVYWEKGVNAQAVAEHAIALMINLCRNISLNDRLLHQGVWHKNGGRQFSGKTVGIIGCGHVGSKVALLAKSFGCIVLVHDIIQLNEFCQQHSFKESSFLELLTESDFISLHVPLTQNTLQMISSKEIALMKPNAFIINTSRGQVINEKELIDALTQKRIAGAGLDVFEDEPLMKQSLYSLDNIVITPHTAGNAIEAVEAMGQAAINGLIIFLT